MLFPSLASDGLAITCLLFEHDWETDYSISHFFAGDVTAGLSQRETRTPAAEALLLTVAVKIWAAADDAQALRQALATLGTGWVGVPILADQFLGADVATAGARVYAAQRLIDLTAPAIVASDADLTADHLYAPLVVGHITELPSIAPDSGDLAYASAVLTEDSPWAFRIGINTTVTPITVWPEELELDWSSPPTQQPVRGLKFERIGQQREQTIADEESALQWTCEAGFTLASRADIATLLAFFLAVRGQWAPFTTSLWFTPGTSTAEAPHATSVRFADRTLKLDFTSGELATTRLKFTEVPWEIEGTEGETPQQPPRLYLYQITYDVPTPVVWRFTNCWRPLTRTADGTYAPTPWEHDTIEGGLDLQTEKVTLNSFLFAGNPLALFNPDVLEGRLWLRIFEVASDPLSPDDAVLVWYGSISAAPQTGRRFAAVGQWLGGLLDREIPNVRYGPRCNTFFFSTRCGHLKADFLKAGTLHSSAGNVIVITTADASAANFFAPGKIELGGGLTYESRQIVASAPVTGGQQLTLDRPLRQAAAAQAIGWYRVCDLTMATCKALDAGGWKGRFRGHPNAPQINYTLPTQNDVPTGKKG